MTKELDAPGPHFALTRFRRSKCLPLSKTGGKLNGIKLIVHTMILKNSKCIPRWVYLTKINGLVLSMYILSHTKHIRKICWHNVSFLTQQQVIYMPVQ
jgi:hypothetical protein